MKTLFDEPWYCKGELRWRLVSKSKGSVEYEFHDLRYNNQGKGHCTVGEWNDHIKTCEARHEDTV